MISTEEALGLAPAKAPAIYKFYNDDVTLYYDDDLHQYTRFDLFGNLVIIPGVTSAIHILDKSAALTQWAANMTTDYIREKLHAERQAFIEMAVAFGDTIAEGQSVPIDDTTVESWLNDARYNFQKYKNAAGDTGKIAHDWVEQMIRCVIRGDEAGWLEQRNNPPEDERAMKGGLAALDWMAAHNVRWVFTERKIYSILYDYAGTADGLAYIDSCSDPECCGKTNPETGERELVVFFNTLTLIDWKTSNRLYDEYEYQTAAYLKAQEEEHNYIIPLRFIIRLGKEDAQFESRLLFPETIERDFQIYLRCLALYRSIEDRKQTERSLRNSLKLLFKAKKQADEEAEKLRKKLEREAAKAARAEAKRLADALYKELRAGGMPVALAKATAYPKTTEEEELEVAA